MSIYLCRNMLKNKKNIKNFTLQANAAHHQQSYSTSHAKLYNQYSLV
ncbi:MAG: hypothetical protein BWY08_00678 [Bacteroidetes bacterium ADurb.Bin174]|jgi:hypothetical protein|nr:MAG: hypothetical protein BWY08_00678 [Bacteroidetes bacterium ADurb.Bin174]